jgi:hypothetical protein
MADKAVATKREKLTIDPRELMLYELQKVRKTFADVAVQVSKDLTKVMPTNLT